MSEITEARDCEPPAKRGANASISYASYLSDETKLKVFAIFVDESATKVNKIPSESEATEAAMPPHGGTFPRCFLIPLPCASRGRLKRVAERKRGHRGPRPRATSEVWRERVHFSCLICNSCNKTESSCNSSVYHAAKVNKMPSVSKATDVRGCLPRTDIPPPFSYSCCRSRLAVR